MPSGARFRTYPARFYLDKYYSSVGAENAAFMEAVMSFVDPSKGLGTVLELGGGPSLCAILAMTACTTEGPERVVWLDAAQSNLDEVEAWLSHDTLAFQYDEILSWLEQAMPIGRADITGRLRGADWDLRSVDLWAGLPSDLVGVADVVGSYFVAECATEVECEFIELTRRVVDASRPGTHVALAYMRDSRPYLLDTAETYPAFAVNENVLPRLFAQAGLRLVDQKMLRGPIDEPAARAGYTGMTFVGGVVPPTRESPWRSDVS